MKASLNSVFNLWITAIVSALSIRPPRSSSIILCRPVGWLKVDGAVTVAVGGSRFVGSFMVDDSTYAAKRAGEVVPSGLQIKTGEPLLYVIPPGFSSSDANLVGCLHHGSRDVPTSWDVSLASIRTVDLIWVRYPPTGEADRSRFATTSAGRGNTGCDHFSLGYAGLDLHGTRRPRWLKFAAITELANINSSLPLILQRDLVLQVFQSLCGARDLVCSHWCSRSGFYRWIEKSVVVAAIFTGSVGGQDCSWSLHQSSTGGAIFPWAQIVGFLVGGFGFSCLDGLGSLIWIPLYWIGNARGRNHRKLIVNISLLRQTRVFLIWRVHAGTLPKRPPDLPFDAMVATVGRNVEITTGIQHQYRGATFTIPTTNQNAPTRKGFIETLLSKPRILALSSTAFEYFLKFYDNRHALDIQMRYDELPVHEDGVLQDPSNMQVLDRDGYTSRDQINMDTTMVLYEPTKALADLKETST
ncbi:hypothetical protein FNV43_RR00272 [Rhamnella rubrinervis]|uniref:Uncharacterized protein n=1 Tax=Rhamnella rubrinervis TaxID=2594499 RepID=A0A8K0HNV3_9ROSA|nr:hypothetical protein FNV43_RR00272 [Rhamnella rubrinervis]